MDLLKLVISGTTIAIALVSVYLIQRGAFKFSTSSNGSPEPESKSDQEMIKTSDNKMLIGPQKSLGTGGFGSVFQYTLDGIPVAVKKANSLDSSWQKRELELLRKVNPHENIVRLISGESVNGAILIVLELMAGTVEQMLEQFPKLSLKTKLSIATQLAKGLVYLHDLTAAPLLHKRTAVLHQDLKTSNLLVDQLKDNPSLAVKISDFGVACEVEHRYVPFYGQTTSTTKKGIKAGTEAFFAPEAAKAFYKSGSKYNTEMKSDVFSAGIILWHVATHDRPKRELAEVLSGKFNDFAKDSQVTAPKRNVLGLTKEVRTYPRTNLFGPIIEKCTQVEIRSRYNSKELLESLNKASSNFSN